MTGKNFLANSMSLLFLFIIFSKRCPQGPKAAMQVVTNYMRGLTYAISDLFGSQSFVIGHLDNGSLPRFEVPQHFFSEPHGFRQLTPQRPRRPDFDRRFQ